MLKEASENALINLSNMRKEEGSKLEIDIRDRSDLLESYINDIEKHSTRDRKSTRLNSSHANISYAVFCLKKKRQQSVHVVVPVGEDLMAMAPEVRLHVAVLPAVLLVDVELRQRGLEQHRCVRGEDGFNAG